MSKRIDHENPFKFEGFCYGISGIATSLFGGFLLFGVKEQIAGGKVGALIGTMLFFGAILLISGLHHMGWGIFRMLRFIIGKNTPRKICNPDLKTMLENNINSTYHLPRGVQYFLESFFYRLSETPDWIRIIALIFFDTLLFSLGAFFIYGLTIFSGYTGLTKLTAPGAIEWLNLFLAFYLFSVWFVAGLKIRSLSKGTISDKIYSFSKWYRLGLLILGAIFFPLFLDKFPLPKLPFPVTYWLIFEGISILLTVIAISLLITLRIPRKEVESSATRENLNWQAQLHPKGLFNSLEALMKQYASDTYPPIVEPRLVAEGSRDKGRFDGHILYETSPIRIETDHSSRLKIPTSAITALSHLSFIWGAYTIFNSLSSNFLLNDLGKGIIVLLFSQILISSMKNFVGEFSYESNLVLFEVDGTYSESVLRSGKGINDSHETESKVVNSDITANIYSSMIKSATLELNGKRYITDMKKHELLKEQIQNHLDKFIKGRRTVANFSNEDLAAAVNITKMNVISRDIEYQKTLLHSKKDQTPHAPPGKVVGEPELLEDKKTDLE